MAEVATDKYFGLGKERFDELRGEWGTPDDLWVAMVPEFGFTIDVAASVANHRCKNYLTKSDDALTLDWGSGQFYGTFSRGLFPHGDSAWFNPPHDNFYPWMAQAHDQTRMGIIDQAVGMALPSFSTNWWHEFACHADEIRLLDPRPEFVPPAELVDAGYKGGTNNDRERCLVIFRRERRHPVAPYIWTWHWKMKDRLVAVSDLAVGMD